MSNTVFWVLFQRVGHLLQYLLKLLVLNPNSASQESKKLLYTFILVFREKKKPEVDYSAESDHT